VTVIRWTERAVADLVAIGEYIAADNPGAARRWVERLRHQAELAAEVPLGGRRVPEISRDDVRETFLRSYRIVYRVDANGISVLTVFEGHRLLREGDIDEG
jgi:plasmid stabilization system protein ParE